jgi:hypothetical protein
LLAVYVWIAFFLVSKITIYATAIGTADHFNVAIMEWIKNRVFGKLVGLFKKNNSIVFSIQSKTPATNAKYTTHV